MRNISLLEKVRDQILDHPETHDQGVWARVSYDEILGEEPVIIECGTAACVCGWACQLSGDRFLIHPQDKSWNGSYYPGLIITAEGEKHLIGERGQEVLGITDEEAMELFNEGLDRTTVLKHLDALINGEELEYAEYEEYDDEWDGEYDE